MLLKAYLVFTKKNNKITKTSGNLLTLKNWLVFFSSITFWTFVIACQNLHDDSCLQLPNLFGFEPSRSINAVLCKHIIVNISRWELLFKSIEAHRTHFFLKYSLEYKIYLVVILNKNVLQVKAFKNRHKRRFLLNKLSQLGTKRTPHRGQHFRKVYGGFWRSMGPW